MNPRPSEERTPSPAVSMAPSRSPPRPDHRHAAPLADGPRGPQPVRKPAANRPETDPGSVGYGGSQRTVAATLAAGAALRTCRSPTTSTARRADRARG